MEEKKEFDIDKVLRDGNIIYIDLSACDVNDLKRFTQKNTPYITKYESSFCILNLASNKLNSSVTSALNMLVAKKFFTVLASDDYPGFFESLQNVNRIYLAVKDGRNNHRIIDCAKQRGIFVNFCQINSDGSIGNYIFKKRNPNNSTKKSSPSNPASKTINKKQHSQPQSKPNPIDIQPIHVSYALNEGLEVFDSAGNSYTLCEKVLANNGASTYRTNAQSIWVKIYDHAYLNTFIENKILRMLKNRLNFQGLCWPMDVALDFHKNFRGYFVKAADGEPLHLSVMKKAGIEKYFPYWNKIHLCTLAITILQKIDFLHRNGVLMGCINPASIRVVDENTVYFTDTDNYQVERFPSFVYNISFTPPELLDKSVYLATTQSENFAIAELVFMILMTGKTPYAVGISGNPKNEIKRMAFPYSKEDSEVNNALPSMWRFMWSHLSPSIKDTFYETFQYRGRYNSAASRKGLDFWLGAITQFRSELANTFDQESLKIYPKTFKRGVGVVFYQCSFCGVEHPRFYFFDRYFDDYHICNDCIDKKSNVSFTCVDCGKTYYYTNRTALYHKQMKKLDADWKDQKHCRDCKNKTLRCNHCGKYVPFYQLKNGECLDCRSEYENMVYQIIQCKNCGRNFEFTYREKEFYDKKGFSMPTNCPECRELKRQKKHGGSLY